jgi:hypothetical protein
VGLVVFPAYYHPALAARDVADNVPAGGHAALDGFCVCHVDDGLEEEGFAVLPAEVLYILDFIFFI